VLFSAVAVVGYMCLLVVVEIEPCGSGTDVLGLIELIVRCTGAGVKIMLAVAVLGLLSASLAKTI